MAPYLRSCRRARTYEAKSNEPVIEFEALVADVASGEATDNASGGKNERNDSRDDELVAVILVGVGRELHARHCCGHWRGKLEVWALADGRLEAASPDLQMLIKRGW